MLGILVIYRIVGRLRPGPVTRGFRLGQVISGGLLALAHGTNDAQKTMGVITLALIANGNLGSDAETPFWVVVSAATAIALGTYMGGWRIIKTMGSRIIKMDTAQGFAAQGSGAAVILASTHGGFPLSTTHTISGAVMGAGAAKRVSAVRWGVAGNIVVAWILTLPAAAAIGGATYGVTRLFGTGAAGPVIVVGRDSSWRWRWCSRAACSRAPRSRRRSEPVLPVADSVVDWGALLDVVIWTRWAPGSESPPSSRCRDPRRHPGGRPAPRSGTAGAAVAYGALIAGRLRGGGRRGGLRHPRHDPEVAAAARASSSSSSTRRPPTHAPTASRAGAAARSPPRRAA